MTEKGKPVYKTSCPDCGSSDANQVFEQEDGSLDSHCFACITTFKDVSDNSSRVGSTMTKKDVTGEMRLQDVASLPIPITRNT